MGSSIDTIAAATATPAKAAPHSRARLGRRRFVDRIARWVVTAGGVAIVTSIAGILLFIIAEVWPLLRPAAVTVEAPVITPSVVRALLVNEYRTHIAGFSEDGTVRVWRSGGAREIVAEKSAIDALGGAAPSIILPSADGHGLAASAGGLVAVATISFDSEWVDGTRTVSPAIGEILVADAGKGRKVTAFSARLTGEGGLAIAAALEGGGIAVVVRESEMNAITGETTISESRTEIATSTAVEHVLLDQSRRNLYASAGTRLFWWNGLDAEPQAVDAEAPLTALGFLYGERSLLAGDARGTVSVWFPVRVEGNDFQLTRIRGFEGEGPVRDFVASPRDKGFFALEDGGRARLHHSTSERTMWTGTPAANATAIAYAPKADGAVIAGPDRIVSLAIDNPHPDLSFKTLFGKVWYEGYEAPAWVWQSTGGTDDFETKFSLVPLLFGTIKGTLYSLLLAIPLAVFGAMYTSQFMHPRLRSWVKPAVELMAAFPSVVLGFMAGLWLAPRLEDGLPALFLATILVPAFVVASGFAWTSVPRATRRRFPVGTEVAIFAVAIVAGVWLCMEIAPRIESMLFTGGFRGFVTQSLGLEYDQRNALIVGLAMGFAVIPIIFAIAEDAFSNVPSSLTSASLALGASRWQTVARVVLPAASPGIFSAVMIGFGRAIGETMIVLMATGNTPIMDWNAFNGFRTLSANIAVEIPEAPHGATLYRTLFLAALLLFAMTFFVNTVAEVVRQRLRRKYSEA